MGPPSSLTYHCNPLTILNLNQLFPNSSPISRNAWTNGPKIVPWILLTTYTTYVPQPHFRSSRSCFCVACFPNDGARADRKRGTQPPSSLPPSPLNQSPLHQLADDQAALEKLNVLYTTVEQSTSPSVVLLPWFPSRTRNTRKEKTKELYNFIASFVDSRRESGKTEDDAVQMLLDQGDPTYKIVTVSRTIYRALPFVTRVLICSFVLVHDGCHLCWNYQHVRRSSFPTGNRV